MCECWLLIICWCRIIHIDFSVMNKPWISWDYSSSQNNSHLNGDLLWFSMSLLKFFWWLSFSNQTFFFCDYKKVWKASESSATLMHSSSFGADQKLIPIATMISSVFSFLSGCLVPGGTTTSHGPMKKESLRWLTGSAPLCSEPFWWVLSLGLHLWCSAIFSSEQLYTHCPCLLCIILHLYPSSSCFKCLLSRSLCLFLITRLYFSFFLFFLFFCLLLPSFLHRSSSLFLFL